jgi:lysophospholipase L1-like esterase
MALQIKRGQTLVFTGDSITDAGRRNAAPPLGQGYVQMTVDLLAARAPAMGAKVINTGVGGDTVRDLHARWDRDVIEHQPDWLTVLVGVNDAWCWLVGREGKAVEAREYEAIYDRLLQDVTKRTQAKLVLMDPFMASSDEALPADRAKMIEALPAYRAAVGRLARKHRAIHVPLQKRFDSQLQHRAADSLAPDAVHPTPAGQAVIAHAWLRAVGW